MFHIVLVSLVIVVGILGWFLAHAAPGLLSRILPARLAFGLGTALIFLGAFGAFLDSYYLRDPPGILGSFVIIIVGLWFMLAPTAHLRGTYRDEQMLRRLFAMLGIVFATIIGSLYIRADEVMALLSLLMITVGFWVITNFFRELDKNRW